jgi:type III secretory pathway component EscT
LPLVVAVLLIDLALNIISRLAPQINVFGSYRVGEDLVTPTLSPRLGRALEQGHRQR